VTASPFTRVLRECTRWGVPVVMRESVYGCGDKQTWWHAPTIRGGIMVDGIATHRPAIHLESHSFHDFNGELRYNIAGAAHELSHAIAMMATGIHPDQQSEEWLLALDRVSCVRMGGDWSGWMAPFVASPSNKANANDGIEWGAMPTQRRGELLYASFTWLTRHGLMRDGKPTYRIPKRDRGKAT